MIKDIITYERKLTKVSGREIIGANLSEPVATLDNIETLPIEAGKREK
jgi:hypothetical protein